MGQASAGQESSDMTQPPSFGERYLFKRNQEAYCGHGDVPSSVDDTGIADETYGLSSLATIEREIKEKMNLKE